MEPTSHGLLDRLELDRPESSDWNPLHRVVAKLLAVVPSDFKRTTWEAFRRFGVDGEPADRVEEELGLSENAMVLANSRVLKRLREKAGDLLE